MAKSIQYPTADWLENYINKHDASLEDAEMAWWDIQIDKGNPTPFDLTTEQEKAVKEVTKGMAKSQKAVDAYGKTVKRERKENPDKRFLINCLKSGLVDNIADINVEVTNLERQIDFCFGDVQYSITLTAHRPKKK